MDAARVANHKVFLYHSTAVAHTLKGNVDYSEPWLSFLARKFEQPAEELEDVGFILRHSIPKLSMGSSCELLMAPPGHPLTLHNQAYHLICIWQSLQRCAPLQP